MYKTRISAHFLDAAPTENERVVIEGWLQYYDDKDKSWKPLKGVLNFYLGHNYLGLTESNSFGRFSFSFPAPSKGSYELRIKFDGKREFEPCYKSLEFKVLEEEEKRKIMKLARNILLVLIAIMVILLLTVYFAKFR